MMITDILKDLAEKKARHQKEIQRIEAQEAWIAEAKELLKRTMRFVGSMTREEFRTSQSYDYMQRFMAGKLEFVNGELPPLDDDDYV